MKNLLAALAVVLAPVFFPALADEGTEELTIAELGKKVDDIDGDVWNLARKVDTLTTKVDTLTTNLGTLTTNLGTLTTNVNNFASRGHQVAIIMTVPRRLQLDNPRRAYNVDFYLVGNSTIPGFPSETVAADGKFASYNAALPAGTYLFELQQPYSDQSICHGNVSQLNVQGSGNSPRSSPCPQLYMTLSHGSRSKFKRFNDGSGVYTVASSGARFDLKHRFPTGFAVTTERPLASYRGAVKITRLK